MKSYIFIGGEVEKTAFKSKIPENALVIAADSGYDNAKKLGYAERCDYIVGDFDSTKEKTFCSRAKIIRVAPEKNETDTHLAINLALELGVEDIFIIGGLSGRLDHTLSNLYLLEFLAGCGISACICDGRNRVRFLKARSSLLIQKSEYKYFGLIPADEVVKGVSIAGAKYQIENVKLTRTNPSFAISNEVSESLAMVSCKEGGLFVIESKELSKKY
jgi:thiamine pyrophosphokinase